MKEALFKIDNKVKGIILFLIGLGILFVLMYKIGFGDIRENVFKAKIEYILMAFLVLGAVLFLKISRWKLLLRKLNLFDSSRIYFIGQAVNEIAPPGSGELTRIYVAKRKHQIPRSKSLVASIIDRFFDVIYLLALASLGLFFIVKSEIGYISLLVPVVLIATAGIVLYHPTVISVFRSILDKFNKRIFLKLSGYLLSLENALSLFHERNRKNQVFGLLLTVGAWSLDGICHFLIIRSFGYDISLLKIYVIVAVAWLLGTFSFLPGGLGVREGIYVLLLEGESIPNSVGISIILIQRFLLYCYFSSGALIALTSYNRQRNRKINPG